VQRGTNSFPKAKKSSLLSSTHVPHVANNLDVSKDTNTDVFSKGEDGSTDAIVQQKRLHRNVPPKDYSGMDDRDDHVESDMGDDGDNDYADDNDYTHDNIDEDDLASDSVDVSLSPTSTTVIELQPTKLVHHAPPSIVASPPPMEVSPPTAAAAVVESPPTTAPAELNVELSSTLPPMVKLPSVTAPPILVEPPPPVKLRLSPQFQIESTPGQIVTMEVEPPSQPPNEVPPMSLLIKLLCMIAPATAVESRPVTRQ
jgi:hypothetical protein